MTVSDLCPRCGRTHETTGCPFVTGIVTKLTYPEATPVVAVNAEPVELAALEPHTDPDGHHWQPAGLVRNYSLPQSPWQMDYVVGLCPCGAVRKFEVPA